MTDNPYRQLPAVDDLADQVDSRLPRALIVEAARDALAQARIEIAAGTSPDVVALAAAAVSEIEAEQGVSIINASGVLLHTNIGRATWSDLAVARASDAAAGFGNLEMDVATGRRSRRGAYVARLLRLLTGAESAIVVNNNASALLLVLAALTKGQAVPVSRGELIEIGGSYRLPAVMEASGTRLVEVGTTNRTRADDYRTALQLYDCGAILKIHPSNYELKGFTEQASLQDLAALPTDLPVVYDLGSGLIDEALPWVPHWLDGEPGVRQSLEAGADLVLFSGDKLIGGPQAGIIVGRTDLVDEVRSHPLARALRVDGATYAALAATLEAYFESPPTAIPFWRHSLADADGLRSRCEKIAAAIGGRVEEAESRVGAGSAPGVGIPSPVIRVKDGDELFDGLLQHSPAILGRRDTGDLVLDLRAVEPAEDQAIIEAVAQCRS